MKSRIKELLQRVFYWDSPAQGAFFGLTLAGIGTWLLLSLFHFLWTLGAFGVIWPPMFSDLSSPAIVTFALVAVTMLLYPLFLILRFYGLICCKSPHPIRKCSFLALFAICLITAGVIAELRGVITVFIVFFCWIFPVLLLPGIGWQLWLGHALLWSLGLLVCDITWNHLTRALVAFYDFFGIGQPLPSCYVSILEFLHVRGSGWPWFLAAGLLLLLLGYLLTARLWARAAELPYRQIFGRGVAVLWLLLGSNYSGQLFLAWRGVKEASQAVAALEQRFGRPMTAQALGELYYNGEQPDPDFWERVGTLQKGSSPFTDEFSELSTPPDVLPPEAMRQWRQHLQNKEASLSQWEQMFAGNIPPLAHSFQPGNLVAMLLPHLSHIKQFNLLSIWRVRLAIEDGDVQAALVASERQANANNSLLRETHLIGGLVWIVCTDVWLDSLEMLLESRLLSDEQLLALESRLKKVEKQVPVMHERGFYSEAVFGLDCFAMLTEKRGDVPGEKRLHGFRWPDFRYFAPQLCWYAALDEASLAQSYRVADFSEMPQRPSVDRRPLWFSRMLLSALNKAGKKFHALTARLRAMQALITAEQYRRRHGAWPDRLENLPEDPFTGELLHYRHGDCVFLIDIAGWNEESRCWSIDTQQRTAPAVQVWSTGPDKADDGGLQSAELPDGHRPDDIRAILRLNPQQP